MHIKCSIANTQLVRIRIAYIYNLRKDSKIYPWAWSVFLTSFDFHLRAFRVQPIHKLFIVVKPV